MPGRDSRSSHRSRCASDSQVQLAWADGRVWWTTSVRRRFEACVIGYNRCSRIRAPSVTRPGRRGSAMLHDYLGVSVSRPRQCSTPAHGRATTSARVGYVSRESSRLLPGLSSATAGGRSVQSGPLPATRSGCERADPGLSVAGVGEVEHGAHGDERADHDQDRRQQDSPVSQRPVEHRIRSSACPRR